MESREGPLNFGGNGMSDVHMPSWWDERGVYCVITDDLFRVLCSDRIILSLGKPSCINIGKCMY